MTFDEWFSEREAFATRGERIMDMESVDALRATWDAATAEAPNVHVASKVEFTGDALNAACWAFINALPDGAHMNSKAWNSLKPAMTRALAVFLTCRPHPPVLPKIDPDLSDTSKEAGK